jgi:hypothetical protein
MCEHTFVGRVHYTLAEYDPDRPWVLVGEIRHLMVELDDNDTFSTWAARAWPPPRYKAETSPDELGPWQTSS